MKRTLTFTRWALLLLAYAVPFALVLAVAPFIGSETLQGPDILRLRLPRVILGLMAGGGLALAGASFQVILRNPLAEPYTLGVTGGSAVGAVLALSLPALAIDRFLAPPSARITHLPPTLIVITVLALALVLLRARTRLVRVVVALSVPTLAVERCLQPAWTWTVRIPLVAMIISIVALALVYRRIRGRAVGVVLALCVITLATDAMLFSTVQLLSLVGAALSLGLIYRLARRPHGISMNTLLLAGVTVSILSAGVIMFIRYLANPYALMSMNRWLMGGLDIIGFRDIASLLPFYLPGLVLLLLQATALNHLSLGEEMAAGHGVEVAAVQRWTFLGGGLLTAAIVSLTGPIGFVGLIVPHAVRRLSGFDQRIVLPASFLLGGAFLTICDTAARTLMAPLELPVGVVTALIGGPLFIRILLGRKR
jgi:iron complex transport system permease protein